MLLFERVGIKLSMSTCYNRHGGVKEWALRTSLGLIVPRWGSWQPCSVVGQGAG